MVLDGRSIVEKKYITFEDKLWDVDEQVQPNGVDLRVHRVMHVHGVARLPSATSRIDAENVQINEIFAKEGWFKIPTGPGNYLVDFREFITVPDGYCAIIIPRSSMSRTGIDIVSGLWDTGFSGRLGATIRNRNAIDIQYGARLAQVLFMKSAFSGHRYNGRYQGAGQSEFKG
jgi:deoxycytidine triphosphate deaminase